MISEERFIEIFDDEDEDDIKYDFPYHDDIAGFILMNKYIPGVNIEGANHDEIYGPDYNKLIIAGITEEDTKILKSMGWMIQDDYLTMYV